MAALSRMAADVHKKVTIMPGDTDQSSVQTRSLEMKIRIQGHQ